LDKLTAKAFEKGLTLVPLRLFFNSRGIVKVIVAVCRGKQLHDKRESLKDADNKRRLNREMRNRLK
jgi:SsrA-binding protein